ncbi:MAG TPA: toprim domain-containing protein, partial [Oscillospiraceae bacterium]|nr:toprim domain-containing protein [Oscillospiraceae bacterium]
IIDGSGPKYLNSGDTPVFKKSRNLFSLNFAKSKKDKRLILAEGYMDVISINQAGFENVVATLGTALTPEQARLMAHYAEEVVIAYDSDGPGQAATHKAINLLGEAGVSTKIIKMNDAKDPDEYIKKFGAIRFKLLLDNSDGAISFELQKCMNGLDMDSDTGKIEYLKRAVKVLADITSPIERDVYISKIASEQSVSKEIISEQTNSLIKKKINTQKNTEWTQITSYSSKIDPINPDAVKFPKETKAEKGIISYLFNNPDKADEISKKLPPDKFITSFNKKVYEILVNKIKKSLDFDISLLSDEFSVDEMGRISEMIAKTRDISVSEKEANDYISVLLSHKIIENNAGISDDDFLKLAQELKNKKH